MPSCHGRLNTGVAFECKRRGDVTHDFHENFVTRVFRVLLNPQTRA
jgi:hypothetical protein